MKTRRLEGRDWTISVVNSQLVASNGGLRYGDWRMTPGRLHTTLFEATCSRDPAGFSAIPVD